VGVEEVVWEGEMEKVEVIKVGAETAVGQLVVGFVNLGHCARPFTRASLLFLSIFPPQRQSMVALTVTAKVDAAVVWSKMKWKMVDCKCNGMLQRC